MVRWKELMFQSTGVTIDAETAMANFTPTKDAVLVGVEIVVGCQAATSLVEAGYVKMTCSTFGGVDLYADFHGNGIRTAPATGIPSWKTECVLPVKSGTPVKGFYYYNVTPVTPELFVYGIFQA